MKIPRRRLLFATLALAILALLTLAAVPLTALGGAVNGPDKNVIRGGGTSLVSGGTGSPAFAPIETKFAFNWTGHTGRFECLALTPSAAAGTPGSGNFDNNIMYVTGTITSADAKGQTAVLKGTATVTGAGAGSNRSFTLTVTSGGPGATVVLEISGMTFNEIVLDGQVEF